MSAFPALPAVSVGVIENVIEPSESASSRTTEHVQMLPAVFCIDSSFVAGSPSTEIAHVGVSIVSDATTVTVTVSPSMLSALFELLDDIVVSSLTPNVGAVRSTV